MPTLTRSALQELAENRGPHCVSIFMPIDQTGVENEQDRLRLKNLIAAAEEKLTSNGMRATEARTMLHAAQRLREDPHIWQQQGRGLAIFCNANTFRVYPAPIELKELLVVTDRFELKPLLALLVDDGTFYVMSMSLDRARLIQATRDSAREIRLVDLPPSVRETLEREVPEWDLDFHTGQSTAGRAGKERLVFHGHGSDTKDRRAKAKIVEYIKRVQDAIHPRLRNEKAPVVLACVEYLEPMVREAFASLNIPDEIIRGHPDRARPDELREFGWRIVRPIFQRQRQEAAEDYLQLSGQGSARASSDFEEVVKAAQTGRISSLFAPRGEHRWGRIGDNGTFDVHDRPQNGDQDLIDFATTRALMTDASVYVVPRSELPNPEADLVAVFRY